MSQSSEVVIVGGGVAGCAVAYYLGKAGIRATLVEREGIATQASGYAAGGLNPIHGVPAPLRPLAMESFRLHLTLWGALKEATGGDCQARMVSMLKLAFDEAELPGLQGLLGEFEGVEGFSAQWADPAAVRELDPRLTTQFIRGLYLYGNAALDSFLYTTSLAKAAAQYGSTCRTGHVRGLRRSGQRASAVILDDGEIPCDTVVLATGPWVKASEEWLGCAIPVEPLKGEILRMAVPGRPLACDILGPDASLYGRSDGLIWCGATTEWRGFDREPSESARQFLRRGATRLMPAMAGANLVRHTACLRPVTADGLPILGRATGWDNIYLAGGAGKKGILLSTGIGRALADLITQGKTDLSVDVCAPQRFARVLA
jgi:glycine oxidase